QGTTVAIGSVVGRIDESAAAPAQPTDGSRKPSAPEKDEKEKKPQKEEEGPRLSPAARRLAEDEGLDIHQLTGTGPGRRITKEDVVTHLEQLRAKPAPAQPAAAPSRDK